MLENDYPIPSYISEAVEKSSGWVETPEPANDVSMHQPPRILAIDCEMVRLIILGKMHNSVILSAKPKMEKNLQGFVLWTTLVA